VVQVQSPARVLVGIDDQLTEQFASQWIDRLPIDEGGHEFD